MESSRGLALSPLVLARHSVWLLAALCCLLALTCVNAQQVPPLLGQGSSPKGPSRPVYVSLELMKVLEINEREYEFKARLLVTQAWKDQRAPDLFKLLKSAARYEYFQRRDSQDECLGQDSNKINYIKNMSTDACVKAQTALQTNCKRFCKMVGSTKSGDECCDTIWIPDILILNLMAMPEDRVVYDVFSNVKRKGLRKVVTRKTYVDGVFRSPLEFRQYPFDSQKLLIQFHSAKPEKAIENSEYHLVPSATWRSQDSLFQLFRNGTASVTGNATQDELAGWKVNYVDFASAYRNTSAQRIITHDFDPEDFANPKKQSGRNQNLAEHICILEISVSRMSNTVVAQSIVPVAFIGILAFLPFFMDADKLDARVSTEVTLFLALTAVQFVFTGVLPMTSYLTNFDVFILLTYSLIFLIVAENMVSSYLHGGKHSGWTHLVGISTAVILFVLYVVISVCIFAAWRK